MNAGDRDLLGLAAKAIGFDLHVNYADATQLYKDGEYVRFWKPLDDDGDALRLAIDCGLKYGVPFAELVARFVAEIEKEDPDPYAAVRRSFVVAAATFAATRPAP